MISSQLKEKKSCWTKTGYGREDEMKTKKSERKEKSLD